jgi:hypothetical protein
MTPGTNKNPVRIWSQANQYLGATGNVSGLRDERLQDCCQAGIKILQEYRGSISSIKYTASAKGDKIWSKRLWPRFLEHQPHAPHEISAF